MQRTLFTLYQQKYPLTEFISDSPFSLIKAIFYQFDYGILIYWILLGVQHSLAYYHRSKAEEVRVSRLQGELIRSELQALKIQMRPQFVFTTLDSISGLMKQNMKAADKMIARLGDFLRLTLDAVGSQEVPLERELDLLRCYLEIEQIRMQGRLEIDMNIDPQLLELQVPNLLLQPIVEDAFHCWFADESQSGRICIRANETHGNLRIELESNGASLYPGAFASRVEVLATRARLNEIYGEAHELKIEKAGENGLHMTLEIPISNGSEQLRHRSDMTKSDYH